MNPWLIFALILAVMVVVVFAFSVVVIAWVLRADSAEHERRTKDMP